MRTERHSTKKSGSAIIYDMTGNLCVWSKAGVIKPTICIKAYDCLRCPVDKKIKQDVAQGKLTKGRVLAGWQVSKDLPHRVYGQNECRHMLSGRVSVKYCINQYDCEHCEYHQMMEDEILAEPCHGSPQTIVSGFALAQNYYYHRGHAWARVEYGGRVRVGLDDFASRLFGPFTAIRMPKMGQAVGQGEPGFGLVRGDLEAECLSPVDGVVVAVNPRAGNQDMPLLSDPYEESWLMVVEPFKLRGNLRNLFFEEESRVWLEHEVSRLLDLVDEDTGSRLAATGGRAVADIFGQVPQLSWDSLKKEFLMN